MLGATPLQNFDPVSSRLENLITELYVKVTNQQIKGMSLEDQVFEIKSLIDMDKQLIAPASGTTQRTAIPEDKLHEPRFADFINLNCVQAIYEKFFSHNAHPELQSRCFKELYNLIEECASKCHELFVSHHSLQGKNQKFHETFQ